MTLPERESYLERLFGLEGRVALVTGGSGALGGAIARGLARAGARVAVLARRRGPIDALVETIAREGGEAIGIEADVTDRSQLESACEALLERWGRVDVLVNAAGGNIPEAIVDETRSFFDISAEDFERALRLNLLGTVLPSQVFARAMSEGEAQDCSIVNISSLTARRPAEPASSPTPPPRRASTTSPAGWRLSWHGATAGVSASTRSRPASSSASRTGRSCSSRTAIRPSAARA